ncbi:hypothetical protein AMATHDRAFT_150233 [Amanita thiersii Skay4041]|uniref:Proline dehydrogenase n=1 Tax=Amanita thiersii Skay4041 TaxID=703135 RepID=A0A2A9NE06_9AGAR|nr:hypothetical protein AMATHDRAFT_150233 [Amanita thiersii Skay4041]
MYRLFTRTSAVHRWSRSGYRHRLALATVSTGALFFGLNKLHADSENNESFQNGYAKASLSSLFRAYTVYSMCSIPSLVEYSPGILKILSSVPGIRQITEGFVRITFFNQFVGGDTAHDTIPLLRNLRAQNKGALLAYSVEVDERTATSSSLSTSTSPHVHADITADGDPAHNKLSYKRIVDEMIRCIDAAADFEDSRGPAAGLGRRTWVAIKITALLPDSNALINLSKHIINTRPVQKTQSIPFPGSPTVSDLAVLLPLAPSSDLTPQDISSLKELHADLERICTRAQQRGVKIIIDAEYSWYQPALDALTLALMRKFNTLENRNSDDVRQIQPLVYGTYQAYLRRTPGHLADALEDARKHNYSLGVKLVRGAYHPYEVAAHISAKSPSKGHEASMSISPDPEPPVWISKTETDTCYNGCVRVLVKAIAADLQDKQIAESQIAGSWRRPSQHANEKGLPRVGVLFGTHNWESCDVVMEELVKANVARKETATDSGRTVVVIPEQTLERVAIGQLYGMSDDLTDSLVNKTKSEIPLVIKYVPYGALSEVMPYLGRRAIENKSVLGEGAAAKERRRAWNEIWARIFG